MDLKPGRPRVVIDEDEALVRIEAGNFLEA
jgi:hypothetical protein